MALCKELAELTQGKVLAESEEGKGSVFYFKLPIQRADSSAPIAQAIQERFSQLPTINSLPKQTDYKILVVEGNLALRQFVVGELRFHQAR